MNWKLLKDTTSHDYDVNLVEDYLRLKKIINSPKTVLIDTKKADYLAEIKTFTQDYCKAHKIDYEAHFSIEHPIIVNSNAPNFFQYLGFSLISWDINKIEAFLDYQMAGYKGEILFPSIVEHGAYDFIKRVSRFDNDLRLKEVMNWVAKKRKFIPISLTDKIDQIKLEWIGDKVLLKKLSKELKIRDYIKKAADFENVFILNQKTGWLKDPAFLAYLLYQLANHYKVIKANKRGHFKAGSQLFYDGTSEVVKVFTKDYLKDLSHNIVTRFPEKYVSCKGTIDYLLRGVFESSF